MVANIFDLSHGFEQASATKPVKIKPSPEQSSDDNYAELEPMGKAEEAETREAIHALLLSGTAVNKAIVHQIEHPPVAVTSASRSEVLKSWGPIVTMAVLAFGFVRYDTTRENKSAYELADLRVRYEQSQVENRKYQNNVLMIEAYQRELERALIQARVNIKLPAFPVLQK